MRPAPGRAALEQKKPNFFCGKVYNGPEDQAPGQVIVGVEPRPGDVLMTVQGPSPAAADSARRTPSNRITSPAAETC